ncbi:MAG: hypothetical protein MRY77_18560 [Rhodobacteraceae bacterium]|nr:hypothetical protein [Paracoccaceae bacterium]
MTDDFANDTTTTGRLEVGRLSHGVIESFADSDWFAFDIEAGTTYRFQLYGAGLFGKTLVEPNIVIYDSNGDRLLHQFGFIQVGVTFTATESGTHFVEAEGVFSEVGSYALKMEAIAPETGDTRDTAIPLTLGTPINLVDDYFGKAIDQDWLSIDLQADTTYMLEVNQIPFWHRGGENVVGQVLTADGDLIAQTIGTRSFFGPDLAVFTTQDAGSYFVNAISSTNSRGQIASVTVREAAEVTGTDGNDWLSVPSNTEFSTLAISGGDGDDMISFAAHQSVSLYGVSLFGEGVLINLGNGLVHTRAPGYMNLLMDSIEHATGSSGQDTLYGHDGNERLRGLSGKDTFFSSGGSDRIDGGSGWDTMDFRFSDAGVSVSLLRGRGWSGDAAGDRYAGIERINGSFHDDILWGDHGNNRLDGSHGDDTLIGNGGDDILIGGFGEDVIIYGGNRADYIVTQTGFRTDVTHLNGGADGHDVILHAEVLRFADGDLML